MSSITVYTTGLNNYISVNRMTAAFSREATKINIYIYIYIYNFNFN